MLCDHGVVTELFIDKFTSPLTILDISLLGQSLTSSTIFIAFTYNCILGVNLGR